MGGLFYPIVYESYYGVWVIYNSCITLHSSIEWFRESYAFSIRILFFYSKYQIVNSTRFGGVSSKFPNSRFNQIGSKTNNKEQHWYFWKKFCFFSFTVHDLKLSHSKLSHSKLSHSKLSHSKLSHSKLSHFLPFLVYYSPKMVSFG